MCAWAAETFSRIENELSERKRIQVSKSKISKHSCLQKRQTRSDSAIKGRTFSAFLLCVHLKKTTTADVWACCLCDMQRFCHVSGHIEGHVENPRWTLSALQRCSGVESQVQQIQKPNTAPEMVSAHVLCTCMSSWWLIPSHLSHECQNCQSNNIWAINGPNSRISMNYNYATWHIDAAPTGRGRRPFPESLGPAQGFWACKGKFFLICYAKSCLWVSC